MSHKYFYPIVFCFVLAGSLFSAEKEIDYLNTGLNIHMGLGYIATGNEMADIWGNGFAWDMIEIGYKIHKNFGFEAGFIMGLTGINEKVKNYVSVYYPSTGSTGSQESAGGGYGAIPLGVNLYAAIPSIPVIFSLGGGGYFGFEEESGIDADGYVPRGSSGLGFYLSASIHYVSIKDDGGIGIRFRYMQSLSDVSDFSVKLTGLPENKISYMDERYIITLDIYVDFTPNNKVSADPNKGNSKNEL